MWLIRLGLLLTVNEIDLKYKTMRIWLFIDESLVQVCQKH